MSRVIRRPQLTFSEYRVEYEDEKIIDMPYQKRLFFASTLSKYKSMKNSYSDIIKIGEEKNIVDYYLQMFDYFIILPEELKEKCPMPERPLLKNLELERLLCQRLNKKKKKKIDI